MRILVCGDRNWTDWPLVYTTLTGYYQEVSNGWLTISTQPFVVIEGGAKGADKSAHDWVFFNPLHGEVVDLATYDPMIYEPRGMPVAHLRFPANWKKLGRKAGPIRNQQMLTEGKPHLVVAFHDNLAASKGTADMVRRAKKAGIPVVIISHG